jgi:aerobic carbon-monoxide dehydrogenase medium subunit
MIAFDMPAPTSLAAAIDLLDTDDSTVRPFSGGTALMLMIKAGVFEPSVLVNLRHIEPEYAAITATGDGGLTIGAMATLRRIELSDDVARIAPSVAYAMKRLSNVRVRNVARIGGNLAHGDPHMDMPPVLSSLGGSVTVRGPEGERTILIEELITGYYQTVLNQGELIASVTLPPQQGWRSAYKKVTTRSADDWPALGVAVSLCAEGDAIADIRIMVASATEKLTRAVRAEETLRGAVVTESVLNHAGEAAMHEVETIGDERGSAPYKRELVGVYVRRAVAEALKQEAVR